MAPRASAALLVIGGIAVAGLGVALYVMTREGAAGPAPKTVAPAAPVAVAEVDAGVVAPTVEARTRTAPVVVRRAETPAAAPAPVVEAVVVDAAVPEPKGKRDENGKLVPMVTIAELRKRMGVTAAPMMACMERATASVSGEATLSFTVGAKDGKLVVESTAVDDAGTLAKSPELLACMHATAQGLQLDDLAVPELGTSVHVRRRVKIEAGRLTDSSIFNFSYNLPP